MPCPKSTVRCASAFPLRQCRQAAAVKYGKLAAAAPQKKLHSPAAPTPSTGALDCPSFNETSVNAAIESFVIDAWANQENNSSVSAYASAQVPGVALTTYASRLSRALLQHSQAVALGVVLALRHREMTGRKATRFTAHRLLLAAIHVAQKTHYDQCACNSYVAEAGGVTRAELTALEWQFLADLDYKVLVTADDWQRTLKSLGVDSVSNASISDDEFAGGGFSVDTEM